MCARGGQKELREEKDAGHREGFQEAYEGPCAIWKTEMRPSQQVPEKTKWLLLPAQVLALYEFLPQKRNIDTTQNKR